MKRQHPERDPRELRAVGHVGSPLSTLGLCLAAAFGCSRSSGVSQEQPQQRRDIAFAVEVHRVEPRRIDYSISAVGSVDAFENVQIVARVAGALETVRFKEGENVKQGVLLAEIEPQRYALAAASSNAALERATAARVQAERELERAKKLSSEGVGSSLEVSNWETKLATASAEESQARAAVGIANINVRDSRVRAPLAGTIQTKSVQTGQYVQIGTVIATLIRRDPLLLRFRVTEPEAAKLTLGATAHFHIKDDQVDHTAHVTHIGGAADPTSRMVQVVGEVEGAAENLRPGSFAEVTVPIGTSEQALAIPETAIRPTERGFLAFVVDGDSAHARVLNLGLRTPDGSVEVKSGLSAGEQLVVRGGEALKDGVKVRISDGRGVTTSGSAAPRGSAP